MRNRPELAKAIETARARHKAPRKIGLGERLRGGRPTLGASGKSGFAVLPDCTLCAGYRRRRSSPLRRPLRFGRHCRDCPPLNFFLVARRISSDSLRSFTALASTSAPTREAMVALASSSRCRCLSPEPIRSLSNPIMPRTPAVNRSRTAWLWRDTSPDTAAKGQPLPGPSRCVGERYFETYLLKAKTSGTSCLLPAIA